MLLKSYQAAGSVIFCKGMNCGGIERGNIFTFTREHSIAAWKNCTKY